MINTTRIDKRNAVRKAMDDLQTIGELIEYSCLEYDNGALFEYVDDKVHRHDEGEAIAKISRIQFLIECKVAASYFEGLTDDDAVAIIAGNSYEWILAFIGIAGCGKTAVAIDQNSSVEDIAYMLDLADCRTVLCSSNATDRVQRAANLLEDASCVQVHCLEGLRGRVHLHSASSGACWDSHHDADNPAAIYFTSGTTGKQKGVSLTHRNIVVSAVGNAKTFRSEGSEKAIACLPFHHCYGLFNGVLSALACGASVYINSRLIRLAGEIRDREVTTAIVVPAMLEMIMKISRADKDLANLRKALGPQFRRFICGGAPLNDKVAAMYRLAGIGVFGGYGLTETAASVANCCSTDIETGVGLPVAGAELRVSDDGEILVKGPTVFGGYLKNPEANAQVFVDGWFKTGDLGRIGERGEFYVIGRIKKLIILANGENIPAEPLEALVYGLPYVKEALVYGDGGVITAEVFAHEEAGDVFELLKHDIEKINESLPLNQCIQKTVVRKCEFPKTASGKIKQSGAQRLSA